MMHTRRIVGIVAAGVAVSAWAGTFAGEAILTLTDWGGNPSAFNGRPGFWSPDISPVSEQGKETDYIVKNNMSIRTPDGNIGGQTFQGKSLTLGASDYSSSGSILYKTQGHQVKLPNLIVYRGGLYGATGYDPGGVNTYFSGNATLYTTFDDPFVYAYMPETINHKPGFFQFVLTGDETTAIKLQDMEPGIALTIVADQSETYSGGWIFGPNQYIHVNGAWKIGGEFVNWTSQTAFGKPLEKFNPKSIQFGDGVVFRYEPWSTVKGGVYSSTKFLPASDNRGITLDEGATVTFMLNRMQNQVTTVDCGYPIAGRDATIALSGDGTFCLRTTSEAVMRPGVTASLALVGNAAANGGLVVTNDSAVIIGESATDRVTVDGVRMTRPMFRFFALADGSDAAQLRLTGDLDFEGRIGICFSQGLTVSATKDIPVIVIDKSVEREFTADDFDPWGVSGNQTPNADSVIVSRNADGDQVVSVRIFPYKRSNLNSGNRISLTADAAWTDYDGTKSRPTADDNVILWECGLQTGSSDWTTVNVPGRQWVFYAPVKAGGLDGAFVSKETKTTWNLLRLLDNACLLTAKESPTRTMEWAGNYDIRTTPGHYAQFSNGGMLGVIVSANLTGRGVILASGMSKDDDNVNYYTSFTGGNSAYFGTFLATNTTDNGVKYFLIKAGAEENFGGNPEVFAADAWKITRAIVFAPTASVTFDDPNRGVTLGDGSAVDTTAGDFIVKTPTVIEGAFRKDGTGAFAYGRDGATVLAGASVSVNGGRIRPEHRDALKGATVTFAADTAFAFSFPLAAGDSRAEAGLDLTATTLNKADAKLKVRLDFDAEEGGNGISETTVPIATFATAEAAQSFVENAVPSATKGYKATLRTDGAVVFADIVKPGMALLIR